MFNVQSHYSTPQAGGSVGLEAQAKTKVKSWRVLSFLLAASVFWRTDARTLEVNTLKMCLSSKWQMGKAGRGDTKRQTPSPTLAPSFITTAQCSAVQSGSDRRAGFQPLRLGYHGNCVLLQLPWLPLLSAVVWCELQFLLAQHITGGLQGGGLAGSGFTQCHGVADSGPNSGTSDALGHSGTGVVGVGGGVEEVLVVVVVVVVVVVRSRYH